MKLMHYSAEPLVFDSTRRYEQNEPFAYAKPVGFWVSIQGEDDWPSWCHGENYRPEGLAFAHEVTLRPHAQVHRIDNPIALDAFTGSYAVQTDFERSHPAIGNMNRWPIDWREVTKDSDGLIIAPYLRRFEVSWYYGWDCASGCIWNLDAIESVELVAEVTA